MSEIAICFECGQYDSHLDTCSLSPFRDATLATESEFSDFNFKAYMDEQMKDAHFAEEFRKASAEIRFHDLLYNALIGYNEECSMQWAAHDTQMQIREILEAMREAGLMVVKEED